MGVGNIRFEIDTFITIQGGGVEAFYASLNLPTVYSHGCLKEKLILIFWFKTPGSQSILVQCTNVYLFFSYQNLLLVFSAGHFFLLLSPFHYYLPFIVFYFNF